jgi:hypothetical protein
VTLEKDRQGQEREEVEIRDMLTMSTLESELDELRGA